MINVGDKVRILKNTSSLPDGMMYNTYDVQEVYPDGGVSVSYGGISWFVEATDYRKVYNISTKPYELLRSKLNSQGERVINASGGIKDFGGKPEPRLLFKSMPEATLEVIKVLSYGANKYSPDNWRLVDSDAYHDAFQRHYLAYCSGEINDKETGFNHISHMVCSLMFLLQKDIEKDE